MAESLANERNGLAWQRTALSWLGAVAVVARYVSEGGVMHARTLLGMLMSAVGVISAPAAPSATAARTAAYAPTSRPRSPPA